MSNATALYRNYRYKNNVSIYKLTKQLGLITEIKLSLQNIVSVGNGCKLIPVMNDNRELYQSSHQELQALPKFVFPG